MAKKYRKKKKRSRGHTRREWSLWKKERSRERLKKRYGGPLKNNKDMVSTRFFISKSHLVALDALKDEDDIEDMSILMMKIINHYLANKKVVKRLVNHFGLDESKLPPLSQGKHVSPEKYLTRDIPQKDGKPLSYKIGKEWHFDPFPIPGVPELIKDTPKDIPNLSQRNFPIRKKLIPEPPKPFDPDNLPEPLSKSRPDSVINPNILNPSFDASDPYDDPETEVMTPESYARDNLITNNPTNNPNNNDEEDPKAPEDYTRENGKVRLVRPRYGQNFIESIMDDLKD